jgi:O-Antigen ligase
VRGAGLNGARAVLLAGPAVLAFFSGGYFDEARAWTGLVVWALVALAAVTAPRLLPGRRAGRIALAGLALFAAWTLLSATWAPIVGDAYHRGQLAVVYAGALIAAASLLHGRRALRAVEPAVVGGALLVVGYGISERLVPGLLHFQHSISAQGRLEQPLTYWNAMGELAAIGLVVSLRVAGDGTRQRSLRLAATAAAAPLGMGLYISFSRGALFACAAGIATLVVVAPGREQLRVGGVALGAAVLGALAVSPWHSVTSLAGSTATRERQGAITLALLAVIMAAAVLAARWLLSTEAPGPLRLPRRAPWAALALICAGLALAIVVGAKESSTRPLSGGATRLTTLQSNRYAYWRVAMRAFGDEPIRGVGAGGWSVYWLRYRPFGEFAQDAHSLPLQTLAELGLVGAVLLATFLGGLGFAARAAHHSVPALAAGPIAGFVTYIAHAPLDWDWEMPALTLFALLLGGAVIAAAEAGDNETPQSSSAILGASRRKIHTASTQTTT